MHVYWERVFRGNMSIDVLGIFVYEKGASKDTMLRKTYKMFLKGGNI